MIGNRDLTLDDYLAMLRRRLLIILVPVVLAPIAGYFVSYAIASKYVSQSLVLVEGQKVAEGYVKPMMMEDVAQLLLTLQQQVLSRARLVALTERLGLRTKPSVDDTIDDIRQNLSIVPLSPSDIEPARRTAGRSGDDVPGFYVNFTAADPQTAQEVCANVTSMLLEENLQLREQVAQGTTDFLSGQLKDAKQSLDTLDANLAAFKREHFGQLPEDQQNNLQVLGALNSQLDANTQTLNRAEQDKSYTELLLEQQVAAWKAGQTQSDPQALEQQLSQLQSQLVTLQARYTDDYPDVQKTKNDIAEVKRHLQTMKASIPNASSADKPDLREPPEIQQMRLQVARYKDTIVQATQQEKRLQSQIETYQGRLAMSPAVEEQYKVLSRDYETGQKRYDDLLAKSNDARMQNDLERGQQAEQMSLLNPASFPDKPSSPNRLLFGEGGIGAGLALGLGMALWLELRDQSLRTEEDLIAILDVPVLASVPLIDVSKGRKQKKLMAS
jgi:polysaccharide chain length determinant protein (PEP-CTERM system associated)